MTKPSLQDEKWFDEIEAKDETTLPNVEPEVRVEEDYITLTLGGHPVRFNSSFALEYTD